MIEQFRAAMLPEYREMIATAIEIQAPESVHRTHLRLALQMLEKATDDWWVTHRDAPMQAALDQTFGIAQCSESCFSHPNNAVKASGVWA